MTEDLNEVVTQVKDLARQTVEPKIIKDDARGIHVVLLAGSEGDVGLDDLTKYEHHDAAHATHPRSIIQKPAFQDANSFLEYVESFKNDNSRIFFDNDNSAFSALLDYHGKTKASWLQHTASFGLRHSEEWKLWFGKNGSQMTQTAFGAFIEENSDDVIKPDAATLLEMAMTFEATKSVSFREATRLKNGTMQLQWMEETKPVTADIPDHIFIKIPVFYNDKPREIQLRFKYSIDTDKQRLMLRYEFVRAQRVKDLAAAEIVQAVRIATGLPVHFGKAA